MNAPATWATVRSKAAMRRRVQYRMRAKNKRAEKRCFQPEKHADFRSYALDNNHHDVVFRVIRPNPDATNCVVHINQNGAAWERSSYDPRPIKWDTLRVSSSKHLVKYATGARLYDAIAVIFLEVLNAPTSLLRGLRLLVAEYLEPPCVQDLIERGGWLVEGRSWERRPTRPLAYAPESDKRQTIWLGAAPDSLTHW